MLIFSASCVLDFKIFSSITFITAAGTKANMKIKAQITPDAPAAPPDEAPPRDGMNAGKRHRKSERKTTAEQTDCNIEGFFLNRIIRKNTVNGIVKLPKIACK